MLLSGHLNQTDAGSAPDASYRKGYRPGMALFIFLITLLTLALVMDRNLLLYDEGIVLAAAMQMHAGEVIHRDFYFVYGPAAPWSLTLLWKLTNYHFMVARFYGVVGLAAIVALSYRLMRNLPPMIMLSSTGTVFLLMASTSSYLYPVFPCIVASLVGAHLLLSQSPRAWNWRPLAAGAVTGLAFLFRYDAGIAIAVAHGIWIWFLDFRARRVGRTRLVRLGLYVAGAGTVIVPALLVGVTFGLTGAFWHDIVISALTYYRTHRALPFPGPAALSRRPMALAVYYPVFALLVATATFVVTRRDEATTGVSSVRTRSAAALMAVMTTVLYYKGLIRVQSLHFMISIIPAIILVALCAGRLWYRGYASRLVAIFVCIITLIPNLLGAVSILSEDSRKTAGSRLIEDAIGAPANTDALAACIGRQETDLAWIPDSYAVVAGYVRRHSSDGEPIFIGLKRHDGMFVNDVALYFIIGRLPGTHWAIFDPGLQTRSDIQAAMIADLSRSQVHWIIRNGAYEAIHEPNQSDVRNGSTLLDRWIGTHYRSVGSAGPLDIWLRDDRPVPADDAAPPRCRLDPYVRAKVS